jgi:hypothetical protein
VDTVKVSYQIFDLDPLEKQHLDANVRYSMLDMLLEARRTIGRLEASRMLNSKLLPQGLQNMVALMKAQHQDIMSNVEKMYSLKVSYPAPGLSVLELFITPDYFTLGDALVEQFGRVGRRMIKVVSQQTIIDKLEGDLKTVYMKKFSGTILENDGKGLRVRA